MTKEELKNVEVSIEVDTTTNIGELLDDDEIDAIYDSLGDNQEENLETIEEFLHEDFIDSVMDVASDNISISCATC